MEAKLGRIHDAGLRCSSQDITKSMSFTTLCVTLSRPTSKQAAPDTHTSSPSQGRLILKLAGPHLYVDGRWWWATLLGPCNGHLLMVQKGAAVAAVRNERQLHILVTQGLQQQPKVIV